MIARVRDCLLVVLLALLAGSVGVAGWRLTRPMDRAEESLILTEETLRIGRAALAEQRIYYRALSRMAVLDANRLGKAIGAVEQAIQNEDARSVNLTGNWTCSQRNANARRPQQQ